MQFVLFFFYLKETNPLKYIIINRLLDMFMTFQSTQKPLEFFFFFYIAIYVSSKVLSYVGKNAYVYHHKIKKNCSHFHLTVFSVKLFLKLLEQRAFYLN